MMKLSKEQVGKFINAEDEVYITKIRKQIQSEHTELVRNESEHSLHKRLKEAHLDLIGMGFKDEALIESYLYLTAFNPDFHGNPQIKNFLEAEDNPEQQYRDFLRVTDNLLKRKH
ncbi:hypothetical protein KKI95_14315 [Xenorhabdus bovienii]|uniref:hypothetical protein n=1 Tax=Xenorhabdus bovienii TaxID=40576 RepID=UPI00237CC970|nr:hypothetical protein [Xenorhabdus bovienii]MDE1476298.1 hypothetical protein [Xenorhabdus bovienii]MDE9437069.1 hypothetical protein [Xenorhabdus bovienii]MDE9467127.1 hypothetical protein [Xenorhabdus bovienii]MDE9498712.1 hypothetical protein [Xenorhabdus bovienii]